MRLKLPRLPRIAESVEISVPESAVTFVTLRSDEPERRLVLSLDPTTTLELTVD